MISNRNVLVRELQIVKKRAKNVQKTGFWEMLLVSFLIVEIFSLSFALALLTDSVVIRSTGEIVATNKITARSGSAEDIQAAVDEIMAMGTGGTVYIPEGDFACNQSSGGAVKINLASLPAGATLNIFGAGGSVNATTQYGDYRMMPATILRSNASGVYWSFFYVGGAAGKHIRISGIAFLGVVPNISTDDGQALNLFKVENFRIDHCFMDSFNNAAILAHMCKGLIDHCDIDDTFAEHQAVPPDEVPWGYGIAVAGDSNTGFGGQATWMPLDDILGKWDTGYTYMAGPVYIEDCTFRMCRHAIASAQYSYFVARHCKFLTPRSSGMQYMDVHGEPFPAGRGLEAYDNEIYGYTRGFGIRGGGGVVFNNSAPNMPLFMYIHNEGEVPNFQNPNDLWIWNNNLTGVSDAIWLLGDPLPVAGVDFFHDIVSEGGPTSPAPPRPGYTPYPYPHPLTIG